MKVLLAPGRFLDGGASEAFIGTGDGPCGFQGDWHNHDEDKWRHIAANLLNVSRAGLAVMPMIGSAGCQSPQLVSQNVSRRAQIEMYAYATFLLVAGTRDQYLGVVPYRFRDQGRGESGGLEMWLHERYYWPIGTPHNTANALEDYRVSRCTLARRFEKALVLVNPTTNCTDYALTLNGTWYDPESYDRDVAADTANNDSDGHGTMRSPPVTRVSMAPQQGRVLLAKPLI